MANYIYNKVGSATGTLPTRIKNGDTLRFNVTNTTQSTKYSGTMLTYTFPFDCTVQLDVAGARGGKGNGVGSSASHHGKGALIQGERSFKQGDILLMCVGQAGTDSGTSTSDGTTGAGGGGTFLVQKTTSGDTYSGAGVGNGWKVTPLIISAGGNGSRDVGYSGSGAIYHGLASTGSKPSYGTYSGGGYNTQYSTTNTNSGKGFLIGASGGTEVYERNGKCYAGFGGGGSNRDDGEGGAGGGYYGGTLTSSATSFVASTVKALTRKNGANDGEGYIIITFKEVKALNARCKINGQIKNVDTMYVKVKGTWREVSDMRFKKGGAWISP